MPFPLRSGWFPRLLFRLCFTAAVLLVGVVVLAPLLDDGTLQPEGVGRMLGLFARDATLRRTAIASAVGLVVSAVVFFRPSSRFLSRGRQPQPPQVPPPPTIAGA
jgi:hypothetical protein